MKYFIATRHSQYDDFKTLIPLQIGMCLTSRINEDREIISPQLPYPDFVYIVGNIKENEVLLIDTAHNNQWTVKPEELDSCELVSEFHKQVNDVDCEFINLALRGFYKYE